MKQPGKILNMESPIIYRRIVEKMLQKFPGRRITRDEAKYILGCSFKISKDKQIVMKELEKFGLLIYVNKQEYYLNYEEVKL